MVDVAGQAVVAILTRAPSAGGKSRLFAALGRPPDPDLLGALLLDTLDGIAAAAAARVVCFTPDDAAPEMRALAPPEVQLLPQGDGDLGARMSRAFERLFAGGASPIVLVGSDLPLIDAAAVGDAFARLRADPGAVVLGPAADGGYYLVGATRPHPALFDRIPWGTAAVLAETRARAAAGGVAVGLIAPGADVDAPDDLRRVAAAPGSVGRRTRAWVARHL